jgi:hypothetical protein
MNENNPDPTKDPKFQKVIRRFVTASPKPHEEMKLGRPKGNIGPKNKPPRRGAGK